MFCPFCGTNNDDYASICATCGADLNSNQPASQPVQQPQAAYQQPVQQPAPVANEAVSVGQWIGSLLLWCIPIAGFVLSIVWAFSKGTNPSKRNFFRAMLILDLIAVVICVIIGVIVVAVGGSLLGGFYF